MASRGRPTKKLTGMEKKIPKNPRYEHVKSGIDTGPASATNYQKRMEKKMKLAPRPDEMFKRIQPKNFARLAIEDRMASLDIIDAEDGEGDDLNDIMGAYEDRGFEEQRNESQSSGYVPSITGAGRRKAVTPPSVADQRRGGELNGILTGHYTLATDAPPPTNRTQSNLGDSFSSRHSNMTGVSAYLDDSIAASAYEKRFLLLDVRTKEEYDQCHIEGAISYPAAMLSRATNYFTKDVYQYKNKAERLIIVYDNDERVACGVATTFFQKGVDNIVLLSGGLKEVAVEAPDFIVGDLPEELWPEPEPTSRGGSRTARSGYTASVGTARTSTTQRSTRTTATQRTTASARSTRSNRSMASQPLEHPRGWQP